MGDLGDPPALSVEVLHAMTAMRHKTHMGFMEREHEKGIMFSPFDLKTPKGQDVARLLFFKVIEEYTEAVAAMDTDHELEELIDTVNYAWSALSAVQFPHTSFYQTLKLAFDNSHHKRVPVTRDKLGDVSYRLAMITESFRNRSWMANAQSDYFDGLALYSLNLMQTIGAIAQHFFDWNEFWQYFMAKDAVLQFRLRSNY